METKITLEILIAFVVSLFTVISIISFIAFKLFNVMSSIRDKLTEIEKSIIGERVIRMIAREEATIIFKECKNYNQKECK